MDQGQGEHPKPDAHPTARFSSQRFLSSLDKTPLGTGDRWDMGRLAGQTVPEQGVQGKGSRAEGRWRQEAKMRSGDGKRKTMGY